MCDIERDREILFVTLEVSLGDIKSEIILTLISSNVWTLRLVPDVGHPH
jgi:hypothetical protein